VITTHIKTVSGLDRLRNTASGNPRYRVTFADGFATTTKPDSAVANMLDNPEMKGSPLVCTLEHGLLSYARPVTDDVNHSPFGRMRDVRAANAAAGHHFFDSAAVGYFDTVVETELMRGRLFVTSEQYHSPGHDGERRYTVRYAMDDGSIENVGLFQQYAGIGEAVTAALEFAG
jgi:hypothetical protein